MVVATLPTVGVLLVTPTLLNAVAGVVPGMLLVAVIMLLVAVMTVVSRLAPAKG